MLLWLFESGEVGCIQLRSRPLPARRLQIEHSVLQQDGETGEAVWGGNAPPQGLSEKFLVE